MANKVLKVTFFPYEGQIETVKLELENPIKRYADRRLGEDLAVQRVATEDTTITFPVATLTAQLVALNKDFSNLRDQDTLDRIDFRKGLINASIEFDIKFVKKGDIKTDSTGKVIPLRDENRVILMTINEKTKLPEIIPATYDKDEAIKNIKALQLTEDAVEYLQDRVKQKKDINSKVDNLRIKAKALRELFPKISDLELAEMVAKNM